ncbi:MAG: hypothetical protein KA715_03930 [Xanthomonadaceae bacterium]|nr:hypothetical protein [Xanthomonadaceae bacterium]
MLNYGVVLVGTGVAPLIAASHFISKGILCTILNPEVDFFLENSELPFRPMHPRVSNLKTQSQDLKAGSLESVAKLLQPEFPGAIESWSPLKSQTPGFHDPDTVHLRARTRLFLKSLKFEKEWDQIEELYLKAQDAGLNSQVLEGAKAVHRFPGFSGAQSNHYRAVSIGGLYDVDLIRYRNELVEYVRERLGPERILCGVSLSEWLDSGFRVYHDQQMKTIRSPEGVVLYWTPRMNSWIRCASQSLPSPKGVRLWEEWLIQSREFLDPSVIGVWEDLIAFSDYEGSPPRDLVSRNLLKVFKPSTLLTWTKSSGFPLSLPYANSETLSSLSEFCEEFLHWERFSISGMVTRVLFEWDDLEQATLLGESDSIVLVPGSDGPLDQVVSQSLKSIARWS